MTPRRALLLIGLAIGSWYPMLVFHEAGHILAAWATQGSIERVVLVPWSFSRTDVHPNPHPAIVLWAGPIFGAVVPLAACIVTRRRSAWQVCVRFFAGFCFLVNGAYLAMASILPVGDAADLLRLGTPAWIVSSAGWPMMAAGMWIWHGLGQRHPAPARSK